MAVGCCGWIQASECSGSGGDCVGREGGNKTMYYNMRAVFRFSRWFLITQSKLCIQLRDEYSVDMLITFAANYTGAVVRCNGMPHMIHYHSLQRNSLQQRKVTWRRGCDGLHWFDHLFNQFEYEHE